MVIRTLPFLLHLVKKHSEYTLGFAAILSEVVDWLAENRPFQACFFLVLHCMACNRYKGLLWSRANHLVGKKANNMALCVCLHRIERSDGSLAPFIMEVVGIFTTSFHSPVQSHTTLTQFCAFTITYSLHICFCYSVNFPTARVGLFATAVGALIFKHNNGGPLMDYFQGTYIEGINCVFIRPHTTDSVKNMGVSVFRRGMPVWGSGVIVERVWCGPSRYAKSIAATYGWSSCYPVLEWATWYSCYYSRSTNWRSTTGLACSEHQHKTRIKKTHEINNLYTKNILRSWEKLVVRAKQIVCMPMISHEGWGDIKTLAMFWAGALESLWGWVGVSL